MSHELEEGLTLQLDFTKIAKVAANIKEEKDNVEHYREEMASYQENKPWRKTSEIIAEVQAAPADAQ